MLPEESSKTTWRNSYGRLSTGFPKPCLDPFLRTPTPLDWTRDSCLAFNVANNELSTGILYLHSPLQAVFYNIHHAKSFNEFHANPLHKMDWICRLYYLVRGQKRRDCCVWTLTSNVPGFQASHQPRQHPGKGLDGHGIIFHPSTLSPLGERL